MSSTELTPHPLAAEGGVPASAESTRDPYEVLDELMAVVEALCPVWPERPIFSETDRFRL